MACTWRTDPKDRSNFSDILDIFLSHVNPYRRRLLLRTSTLKKKASFDELEEINSPDALEMHVDAGDCNQQRYQSLYSSSSISGSGDTDADERAEKIQSNSENRGGEEEEKKKKKKKKKWKQNCASAAARIESPSSVHCNENDASTVNVTQFVEKFSEPVDTKSSMKESKVCNNEKSKLIISSSSSLSSAVTAAAAGVCDGEKMREEAVPVAAATSATKCDDVINNVHCTHSQKSNNSERRRGGEGGENTKARRSKVKEAQDEEEEEEDGEKEEKEKQLPLHTPCKAMSAMCKMSDEVNGDEMCSQEQKYQLRLTQAHGESERKLKIHHHHHHPHDNCSPGLGESHAGESKSLSSQSNGQLIQSIGSGSSSSSSSRMKIEPCYATSQKQCAHMRPKNTKEEEETPVAVAVKKDTGGNEESNESEIPPYDGHIGKSDPLSSVTANQSTSKSVCVQVEQVHSGGSCSNKSCLIKMTTATAADTTTAAATTATTTTVRAATRTSVPSSSSSSSSCLRGAPLTSSFSPVISSNPPPSINSLVISSSSTSSSSPSSCTCSVVNATSTPRYNLHHQSNCDHADTNADGDADNDYMIPMEVLVHPLHPRPHPHPPPPPPPPPRST